ncbi:MAG TPA: MFS transporter [Thermomicrobiales bacterium]|jgi:fucose permease
MGRIAPTVRRRITGLNYFVVMLSGLASGWLGPFLPQIAAAEGVTLERAGLMVSAVFAGFLLAMLLAGWVVGRWGGGVGLALAAALLGGGCLGVAAAPNFAGVLMAALLIGLGSGLLDVAGHATTAALNPERVAAALNALNVFYGIGALLGPLIVALSLRGHVPYRVAYACAGLAAGAASLILLAIPFPHVRDAAARPGEQPLLASRALWLLGLTLVGYIGLEAGFSAWLFPFLREVGGFAETSAARGVSLFWVGLIGGRVLRGRRAARGALRPQTLGSAAFAAASLLLLARGPAWPPLQLMAILAIGFGCGPLFANTITTGVALFPHRVGAMTAAIIAIGSLGGIVVPRLMGHALAMSGPRAAMLIACAAAMLLICCYWSVAPRSSRSGTN